MFGLKGSEVQTEKGIWQPSQCSNSNGLTRVDGNFRDDENSTSILLMIVHYEMATFQHKKAVPQ
jgi:hypothetical protein